MKTTLLLAAAASQLLLAESGHYPPLAEYLMPRDAEIALARSAAPASIASHATIKVLTASGFSTVREGDNGFVCLVLRGFTGAPTISPAEMRGLAYDAKTRAPICLDSEAVRLVLPYYEFRTALGIAGKTPDEITAVVEAAYVKGELPRRDSVSFGYMWSADQILGPAGHWHPHIMIYAPYYTNSMLGGNDPGSHLPTVGDDAGTPFAVAVIPVDDKLAIKAEER